MSTAMPTGERVLLPREPWLCETTQAWLTDALKLGHVRLRDMLGLLLADLVGCSFAVAGTLMGRRTSHIGRRVELARSQLTQTHPSCKT